MRGNVIVFVRLGRFRTSGRHCLSRLVLLNLLVNGLKIQVFKVRARTMLDQISLEQLKSFEVPLEQDGVIFIRGLESSDGLGHGNFHPLSSCCKEFVLLLH